MINLLPWQKKPLAELLARRDKLPHALLIHGNQGIGKVEFAKAVAQSLLCEENEHGIACGKCDACGWFRDGNHPDYRELLPENMVDEDGNNDSDSGSGDGAIDADPKDAKEKKKSKEIKIDQVRAIADFMTLSTHRDGFRVLVIHPAETMNMSAANALLKTLEEPGARTVILLVTDQTARLMATIRSRCQRVLLPSPAPAEALQWLTQQGVAHGESALAMAGGSPLDALSFATGDYQRERKAFVAALSDPAADYMAAAQSFEKSDLNHVITWLQTWVSDVALSKFSLQVRHHVDEKKAIADIAKHVQLPKLFRYESELRQARRSIAHPLNARLLLEQLLISYQRAVH